MGIVMVSVVVIKCFFSSPTRHKSFDMSSKCALGLFETAPLSRGLTMLISQYFFIHSKKKKNPNWDTFFFPCWDVIGCNFFFFFNMLPFALHMTLISHL